MKVAQLVREQQAEAKERERIQQELQVAALIQQTLLPKELPPSPAGRSTPSTARLGPSAATSTTSSISRTDVSAW